MAGNEDKVVLDAVIENCRHDVACAAEIPVGNEA
jgi:hypothetical protein